MAFIFNDALIPPTPTEVISSRIKVSSRTVPPSEGFREGMKAGALIATLTVGLMLHMVILAHPDVKPYAFTVFLAWCGIVSIAVFYTLHVRRSSTLLSYARNASHFAFIGGALLVLEAFLLGAVSPLATLISIVLYLAAFVPYELLYIRLLSQPVELLESILKP